LPADGAAFLAEFNQAKVEGEVLDLEAERASPPS
jgi:hypothetical protein